ncbi:MAG: nitrogen fixation protein NifM [Granulosicoccaceae bacterium]|jgi:peptidyl-prolyl cis-trans isomerase C
MNHKLQKTDDQRPPEYAYHVLRGAVEKYSKGVVDLTDEELALVCKQADKTLELESRVLASSEAQEIVIQQTQVENAIKELAGRYPNYDEFLDDIHTNGMTEDTLHRALHRELLFDAVMNKVASRGADISDIDVQLFYQLHMDRFDVPEIRHARHLLITINPDYADNQRDKARQRIDKLHAQLTTSPSLFEELVMKNSECPTALEGGVLGKVKKGMLYPELDEVLFQMQENQISDVVETEVGFHILFCEKIDLPKKISFFEAKEKIKAVLEERRIRNCQKAWLAELGKGAK